MQASRVGTLAPTIQAGDLARTNEHRRYGRIAGVGLLLALASIVILYGGSSAVAGMRPDNAIDAATVATFYGHQALAILFTQAVFSVFGIVIFALAFRRYLNGFVSSSGIGLLVDVGTALVLVEAPVLFVAYGLELALVRLAALGEKTTLLGVFMAWDWIDNGTLLWLEFGWMAAFSLAAWLTRGLPRWLAAFGLSVAVLVLVFAAPGLLLGYPVGTALVGYGPWMIWMLITGTYLARGGRATT